MNTPPVSASAQNMFDRAQVSTEHMKFFSALLGVHVLAFDYRGFADSTGDPTEQGLYADASAALNWLRDRGVLPSEVLLWGHSLGTGVASHLAREQERKGQPVHCVVLEATYLSLRAVSFSFPGTLPIRMLPFGTFLMRTFFAYDFPNDLVLPELQCPILLLHGTEDIIVPFWHSQVLLAKIASAGRCRKYSLVSFPCDHLHVVFERALLGTVVNFLESSDLQFESSVANHSTLASVLRPTNEKSPSNTTDPPACSPITVQQCQSSSLQLHKSSLGIEMVTPLAQATSILV